MLLYIVESSVQTNILSKKLQLKVVSLLHLIKINGIFNKTLVKV